MKGKYVEIAHGIAIGNRRLVSFEEVSTTSLKISFEGMACPVISNVEAYRVPVVK
jgi:hypothetical protein